FRNAGRPRDLFRGGVLVTERDEQMLGVREELAFAIGFAHAGHTLGRFNPAALGGTHRLPHRLQLKGRVSNDYFIGRKASIPEQVCTEAAGSEGWRGGKDSCFARGGEDAQG